uniref:Uncharacterized protein n=1 Tax=Oryza punctata TaxID=4537 RepID=A0A0E0M6J0_ORYPU
MNNTMRINVISQHDGGGADGCRGRNRWWEWDKARNVELNDVVPLADVRRNAGYEMDRVAYLARLTVPRRVHSPLLADETCIPMEVKTMLP